jgi:hypothetical protein
MRIRYLVVFVFIFLLISLASGEIGSEKYREDFEIAKSELKEIYNDLESLRYDIIEVNATVSSLMVQLNAMNNSEIMHKIEAERNVSSVLEQKIADIRSLGSNEVLLTSFAILGFLAGFWACFSIANIL